MSEHPFGERRPELGTVVLGARFGTKSDAAPPPGVGEIPFNAAAWLDCWSRMDGRSRFVATTQRVLLNSDHSAAEVLASGQEIRLRNGRVETTDPANMEGFELLFRADESSPATYCMPRKGASGHLVFRAILLTDLDGMGIVGVAFHSATDEFNPEWADFASAFSLTAAEHQIVRLLLSGRSPDRIAKEQALSINTVRTHISHIHDKLGVSSREGLWKRLAPYRVR